MNKLIFLGLIPVLFLVSNVYVSDINCDERPNHDFCNGERGRQGMAFCPEGSTDDCYSRDYSQIDCNEIPTHSRCVGLDGMEGLMFCDLDPDADPCYDRED